MTGTPNLARRFFITLPVCQAALSRRITEFSCQPGVSWSSCRNKYQRNNVITSASVLACVSEVQMRPSVSRASNRDILGATCLSVTVPAASVGTQILLRNRVWLSQLWSTLITRRPFSKRSNIRRAYYCRSTRHRSVLLWMGTFFANLYPIARSFLITLRTSLRLTSRSASFKTFIWIC